METSRYIALTGCDISPSLFEAKEQQPPTYEESNQYMRQKAYNMPYTYMARQRVASDIQRREEATLKLSSQNRQSIDVDEPPTHRKQHQCSPVHEKSHRHRCESRYHTPYTCADRQHVQCELRRREQATLKLLNKTTHLNQDIIVSWI